MSAQSVVMSQNVPAIVLSPLSAAATVNATSAGVDLTGYEGVVSIVVNTGAITGTLDGVIEDSADNSSFNTVTPVATFAQVTAANKVASVALDVRSVRRYIRYKGVIVTGPVLVSVVLNGFKKVSA